MWWMCVAFWGTATCFPNNRTIFHSHQQNKKVPVSPYPLPVRVVCFYFSHSDGCEVASHCGFWFAFTWWLMMLNIFSCDYYLFSHLWWNTYSDPLSIFIWVVYLLLSFNSSLCVLDTSPLSKIWFAEIFFHSVAYLSLFCWCPLRHKQESTHLCALSCLIWMSNLPFFFCFYCHMLEAIA